MNVDNVLIATLAAAPGIAGAYLAYKAATGQSRRDARIEARKVDSEAFDRAANIYREAIDQLQEQVKEQQVELKDLQERDRTRERELTALRRRNAQLERAIAAIGGTVPPMEGRGH